VLRLGGHGAKPERMSSDSEDSEPESETPDSESDSDSDVIIMTRDMMSDKT
jgi:hypothetical protein